MSCVTEELITLAFGGMSAETVPLLNRPVREETVWLAVSFGGTAKARCTLSP